MDQKRQNTAKEIGNDIDIANVFAIDFTFWLHSPIINNPFINIEAMTLQNVRYLKFPPY